MDDILKQGEMKPKSSNTGFEIPFDVVSLPSKGLLYTSKELAGVESLDIHYLTAIQEDILTSPNLLQSGKMLDALLTSVLKNKSINPQELTLGDRNAIIIWLRSTGYGADYPVRVKCKDCGNEWINDFDLSSLAVVELELVPDADGLFSFTLPTNENEIRFRFLTSEDEMNILKRVEAIQKKQGSSIDNSMSLKMMASIAEVDGERDQLLIKRFVEFMPVRDARAFREYVNSVEPGINMEQDVECPSCGEVNGEVIPIRGNFFWPDSGV